MDDFDSMFSDEELNEPVHPQDLDQFGESLSNAMFDVHLIFTRTRRQYQGDTWISAELWNLYCLLDQAYERAVTLIDQGAFPEPPKSPGADHGVASRT